jgi:hypothetical protein
LKCVSDTHVLEFVAKIDILQRSENQARKSRFNRDFRDSSLPKRFSTFPHRFAPANPKIIKLVIVHFTEIAALMPAIRPDAEDRHDHAGEP